MSNAMRLGKRSLAGAAAVALGAALIPFTGMGAAQAATGATSIAFDLPSYTIITDDWSNASLIPVPITVRNVDGGAITSGTVNGDGAALGIRLSVAAPATALDDTAVYVDNGSATVLAGDDSGILVTLNGTTTGSSLKTLTVHSAAANGLAEAWANLTNRELGTYTLTAQLYSLGSGAVVSSSSMTIQTVAEAAAPAPTITFWNSGDDTNTYESRGESPANPITRLGVTTGAKIAAQKPAFVQLTNSTGGPYLGHIDKTDIKLSFSVAGASSGTYDEIDDEPWQSGTAPGTQWAEFSGIYNIGQAADTSTWSTLATGSVTATFTVPAVAAAGLSSTLLPVNIGSLAGSGSLELTTTPNSPDANDDYLIYAPVGTTQLNFAVQYSDASAGTYRWNARSSRNQTPLGLVTPSGGVAALNGVGQGSFSINLAAAATRADDTVAIFHAGTTYTVQFKTAGAVLDAAGGLAQVGTAASVAGVLADRFGGSVTGTWIAQLRTAGQACSSTATPLATAPVAADGTFTLTVPAAQALTAAGTKDFGVCASNGISTVPTSTAVAVTVTYTATGQVNSLTLNSTAPGAGLPVVKTPARGIIDLADGSTLNAAASEASANVNAAGTTTYFTVTPVAVPSVPVELTVTEGAYLSSRTTGTFAWNLGVTKGTAVSSTITPTWVVYATKPGVHTVTATVGTTTTSLQFIAGVPLGSGRVIAVDPAEIGVAAKTSFPLTVTITDIYGNAVPDDTVLLQGSGAVNNPNAVGRVGKDGKGTFLFTAGEIEGAGIAQFTIGNPVQSPVSGSPAAVTTVQTRVSVGAPATKSIVIVGERATVNGKAGVRVEGDTVGIADGAKVKPWVRFPGQSDYTVGTARPTVDAAGDFSWQRKTGKKTYVFFTTDDDSVKSNRVIIPAK